MWRRAKWLGSRCCCWATASSVTAGAMSTLVRLFPWHFSFSPRSFFFNASAIWTCQTEDFIPSTCVIKAPWSNNLTEESYKSTMSLFPPWTGNWGPYATFKEPDLTSLSWAITYSNQTLLYVPSSSSMWATFRQGITFLLCYVSHFFCWKVVYKHYKYSAKFYFFSLLTRRAQSLAEISLTKMKKHGTEGAQAEHRSWGRPVPGATWHVEESCKNNLVREPEVPLLFSYLLFGNP